MDFQSIIDRGLEIRRLYEQKENNSTVHRGQVKKSRSGLSAMWVISQNLSLQRMANVILKPAKKNWGMSCLIVCGR